MHLAFFLFQFHLLSLILTFLSSPSRPSQLRLTDSPPPPPLFSSQGKLSKCLQRGAVKSVRHRIHVSISIQRFCDHKKSKLSFSQRSADILTGNASNPFRAF